MPGFCPNEHYLREMQRYGVLPADHDPTLPGTSNRRRFPIGTLPAVPLEVVEQEAAD